MNFADRLLASIQKNTSFIVAGFDPQLETLPRFILEKAARDGATNEDSIYNALVNFHREALTAVSSQIAAVKPNIAFFEQYGLGGLKAFASICALIREHGLPVIADVKRGDIGSTAQAYSSAFLGQSMAFGKRTAIFDVDAITVNPFLGFDTVETYFKDCKEFGKGLFVLVKTSNPGSASIQGLKDSGTGRSISETVARWLAEHASELQGTCGYSGLGAVVGATYPAEARALRELMPTNLFLIPGMGAQGGTASDSVAGFSPKKSGAIINISRGLLGSLNDCVDAASLRALISERAGIFNKQISEALC